MDQDTSRSIWQEIKEKRSAVDPKIKEVPSSAEDELATFLAEQAAPPKNPNSQTLLARVKKASKSFFSRS
jgi:hypothetical protein